MYLESKHKMLSEEVSGIQTSIVHSLRLEELVLCLFLKKL